MGRPRAGRKDPCWPDELHSWLLGIRRVWGGPQWLASGVWGALGRRRACLSGELCGTLLATVNFFWGTNLSSEIPLLPESQGRNG